MLKPKTSNRWSALAGVLLTFAVAAVCELLVKPVVTPPPLGDGGRDTFATICTWLPGTPLAFAGWATWAELGMADPSGVTGPDTLVYVAVSRIRVRLDKNIGPPAFARGFCWTDGKTVGITGVADDWAPPR